MAVAVNISAAICHQDFTLGCSGRVDPSIATRSKENVRDFWNKWWLSIVSVYMCKGWKLCVNQTEWLVMCNACFCCWTNILIQARCFSLLRTPSWCWVCYSILIISLFELCRSKNQPLELTGDKTLYTEANFPNPYCWVYRSSFHPMEWKMAVWMVCYKWWRLLLFCSVIIRALPQPRAMTPQRASA